MNDYEIIIPVNEFGIKIIILLHGSFVVAQSLLQNPTQRNHLKWDIKEIKQRGQYL